MSSMLLLLLDSRAPAGAHAHSAGMEAAVMAGLVADLDDVRRFCSGRLSTGGRVAAAFGAAGALAWQRRASASEWELLDAELSARTPSPASRSASRALGNGLRRLIQATVPAVDLRTPWHLVPRPAPHHPLVLGAACVLAGAGPGQAARAAALGICTSAASAGVRLLGLDPYAVQRVLIDLAPRIDQIADEAAAVARTTELALLPADSAPALELLADIHVSSEVRLFAS
jgi:urease accessory protein